MEASVGALLLLGTLALPETWAGPHSLRYFNTAMTRPGLGKPRFLAVGYVDDQQFMSFDSDSPSQGLEPRVAWMERVEQEEPEFWERRSGICKAETQFFRGTLESLLSLNQSSGGVHTIQRLNGCEVSPDLTFQRGFIQYAYDGQDYLALDTETYKWTAAVPEAVNIKQKWEADGNIVKRWKAYLNEECVRRLKKYLEAGKETLMRKNPPSARVTRHTAPHGEVTLRCRAQDFYPKEISLIWLRDGEEQPQDTEFIETRPAGDGTFQKWADVVMTSGQEDKYTCQVQHEGLSEPLTLQWEPQSSPTWYIVGGIAAGLLLTAVIAGVEIWRRKHSGGKGGDYVPAADNDSPQGSDVSLTAKN
ncbi:class I histocompatibility antigen, Gogo-OKO alpha chain-like isoform X1 [Notamacropus eugenii]